MTKFFKMARGVRSPRGVGGRALYFLLSSRIRVSSGADRDSTLHSHGRKSLAKCLFEKRTRLSWLLCLAVRLGCAEWVVQSVINVWASFRLSCMM